MYLELRKRQEINIQILLEMWLKEMGSLYIKIIDNKLFYRKMNSYFSYDRIEIKIDVQCYYIFYKLGQ